MDNEKLNAATKLKGEIGKLLTRQERLVQLKTEMDENPNVDITFITTCGHSFEFGYDYLNPNVGAFTLQMIKSSIEAKLEKLKKEFEAL